MCVYIYICIHHDYVYIYIKGGLSWVGKMCCKAPGGKCAKSISKSRKRKSRKVERCMYDYVWTSKSGKSILFDFSLFDCLNFCRMPFQLNKRRLKVQNLNRWESRGTLKSWKVERWEGSRKVEKSHILNFDCYFFSPGCLSSWTSAATSTKLKPLRVEREEEKPKSRKVERWEGSRKVDKYTFCLLQILTEFFQDAFQLNMRS